MTSDQLADHLVSHFNDIQNPAIAFHAIKPETIAETDAERSDYAVFVIPYGESETAIDRGDMSDERRTVSVVVNGPIRSVERSTALAFSESLRRSLRETEFDGYRWASNEVVSVYDFAALKTNAQFLHLFRATYFAFA